MARQNERPLDPLLIPDHVRRYWLARGRDIAADLQTQHAIWRARQHMKRTGVAVAAGVDLAVLRDLALVGCGLQEVLFALGCGDEWKDVVAERMRVWRRYGAARVERAVREARRARSAACDA